MPEPLKKFSAAVLEDFKKALASQPAIDLVSKTKAADAAGAFKVIISTSDEDRQGDSIDQTKCPLLFPIRRGIDACCRQCLIRFFKSNSDLIFALHESGPTSKACWILSLTPQRTSHAARIVLADAFLRPPLLRRLYNRGSSCSRQDAFLPAYKLVYRSPSIRSRYGIELRSSPRMSRTGNDPVPLSNFASAPARFAISQPIFVGGSRLYS